MATSTITIISGASTVTLDNTVSTITLGTSGPQGAPGEGVPVGGTTGQILQKDSATDYDTSWIDNYTTDVRKYVKNDSGSTLAKGTVVYVSGANGANVLVKPALATTDGTSATTIGFLNETLASNGQGYAIVEGTISGIDTSAATAGDPVWLSGAVAGGVLYGVANKPQAPVHIVYLGTVTRAHATQGQIEISVNNGWELDELHNVKITSPANGQVLTYDSAQSLWVNSSETGDISAVNVTAPITGGGTSGAVTIGIDQTALAIAPSQVTGTAVITTDPRLSDARTPTAHASTHAVAGSDPVTLAQSQVTNLTTDLAGKAALASANTFSVGGHVINSAAAATTPLRINGALNQSTAHLYITANNATGALLNLNDTVTVSAGGRLSVRDPSLLSASLNVATFTASNVGAIIRGAASQSANLQEWQDSSGNILASVNQSGYVRSAVGFASTTSSLTLLQPNYDTSGWGFVIGGAAQKGVVVRGAAAQTANLQEWQNSAGTVLAQIDSSGGIRTNAYAQIRSGAAGTLPLYVRGFAGQTANLQEWQDSGGTVLARVSSVGSIYGTTVQTLNGYVRLGEVNSGGALTMLKQLAATVNPGADTGRLYFRDGTTAGTLKLVVRAGASGAETTILDNIPQ